MAVQLPLAFQLPDNMTLDSFIPGENGEILHALKQLVQAPVERLLYISGPTQSGKTHLASAACLSASESGLSCAYLPFADMVKLPPEALEDLHLLNMIALDDVQLIAGKPEWEKALFTLFNQARDRHTRLLFTANCGPASLPLDLPDLKSRLSWGVSYKLITLTDEDKVQLLLQAAEQRGLILKQEAARYILSRYSRDISGLLNILDQLDHASMAAQRKLTLPFVRQQLQECKPGYTYTDAD
jgi:DnaA family protein